LIIAGIVITPESGSPPAHRVWHVGIVATARILSRTIQKNSTTLSQVTAGLGLASPDFSAFRSVSGRLIAFDPRKQAWN
jgi:hypothetical protein